MKIGVFGTGMVGEAIASKLVALGHEVMMSSREPKHPKAVSWAKGAGFKAHEGTFADSAAFGELLFNCTHGAASVEVLRAAGERRIARKIFGEIQTIDIRQTRDLATAFLQVPFSVAGRPPITVRVTSVWRKTGGVWLLTQSANTVPTVGSSARELLRKSAAH